MRFKGRSSSGFTMIELLMVLALLGILAATFVPKFLAAHHDARQAAVVQDLAMFQRLIALYREHHNGHLPAQGTDSEETFLKQLRGRTTVTGNLAPDGKYGPYLKGDMPANPYGGASTVLVIAGPIQPQQCDGNGKHGWVYSSTTGEVRANLRGAVVETKPTSSP